MTKRFLYYSADQVVNQYWCIKSIFSSSSNIYFILLVPSNQYLWQFYKHLYLYLYMCLYLYMYLCLYLYLYLSLYWPKKVGKLEAIAVTALPLSKRLLYWRRRDRAVSNLLSKAVWKILQSAFDKGYLSAHYELQKCDSSRQELNPILYRENRNSLKL